MGQDKKAKTSKKSPSKTGTDGMAESIPSELITWPTIDTNLDRRTRALDMAINSLGGVARSTEILPVAVAFDSFLQDGKLPELS